LENCRMCALGAGAAVTETLKNLVLPGVGSFTVVDAAVVRQEDLGNNFFYETQDVGKPRAEASMLRLAELNENVEAHCRVEDPGVLVARTPEFFDGFDVVLAGGLAGKSLRLLGEVLWEKGIPLVVVRAYGMLGYVRLEKRGHCVLNRKEDFGVPDLGLWRAIPGMAEYVASFDLPALPDADHAHVPWPVLLLKARQQFESAHGRPPAERADLAAVRDLLEAMRRKGDEVNFSEAAKNAGQVLPPRGLSDRTRALLAESGQADVSSDPFWTVVGGLRVFVEERARSGGRAHLPLVPAVPDMQSDTDSYIQLQKIVYAEAERDAKEVLRYAEGRSAGPTGAPSIEYTRKLCSHAGDLEALSLPPLHDRPPGAVGRALAEAKDSDEHLPGLLSLLFAAEEFCDARGRWPGDGLDSELAEDVAILREDLAQVLIKLGLPPNFASDDLVQEFGRWGCAELHTIAAIVGGMASMEIVKLLSGQFVPIQNTFLYNGMTSSGTVVDI